MRDMIGMSWRGVFWTAPSGSYSQFIPHFTSLHFSCLSNEYCCHSIGVLYAYYDLGWLPALSGVWMGVIYYFAQFSPHGGHNFEQG
jgi:hypothetical protein